MREGIAMAAQKQHTEEIQKEHDFVSQLMDQVIEDRAVPRNIRATVEDAKKALQSGADGVNVSKAIYLLDDISNDINIPQHSRTEIWGIISALEALKEKLG